MTRETDLMRRESIKSTDERLKSPEESIRKEKTG